MAKDKYNLTKPTIRLLWAHASRYPVQLYLLLILLPLNVLVADFLRPFITATILGRLSAGQYDHAHIWRSFAPEIIGFVAASFLSIVVGWRLIIWLIGVLELNASRDLSQRIFTHLLDMSPSFHANRFGGSIVSQTNKLTGAYVRLIEHTTFMLIPLVVSIIATITILAPRAPLYVAVLLALTIAYLAGALYFSRQVREANSHEAAEQSRQTGYLADSIANIFAIKTFSATSLEQERFLEVSQDVRDAGLKSLYATLKRQNYASILTQALGISALVIAVVGVGVLRANIATIFLMVSYTASLADRLWSFQNMLRQYNRAFGDAHDMVEILGIEAGIKDPVRPERSKMRHGAIEFKNVSFSHGESDDALFEDFNLVIRAGEKIGLVGHSGSGKTSLTRLLLRFADLDRGQITIDDQDITRVTQDDLRRAISYVPQEPLLFHRTLRENIAYGQPTASTKRIKLAAKQAHAAEFIDRMPAGYDTLVGERGIKLSGGQRQRIAIARAILKDAPVLVLDEATSALDSESESLIQDALWKLMEGRTAIVIAHRLSTIQRMDRIVVLDNGRIVEDGSHAELIKHKGVYARLWARQSGGFIEE